MEVKDLLKISKKHFSLILGSGLVFGLIGVLSFYFLPKVYRAEGSFYISRLSDDSTDLGDFTYEGFYAQQAASNYTGTFVALLESVDVKRNALLEMGRPVTGDSLRRFSRSVSVKKPAPQVVSLTVSSKDPEEARNAWTSVAQQALLVSDASINVVSLSKEPIVLERFNNLYVNAFVGLGFGLFLGLLAAFLKEYLS